VPFSEWWRVINNETVTASAIAIVSLLFENNSRVPTTFTCMGEAGIGTIFPKTHNNGDFPECMRLTCTAASAKACIFFSEAWEPEISVDDNVEILTLLAVPLSEQPDGHECLVLLVETRGEKTSYIRFPITKDGTGKRTLGKPVQMSFDKIDDRFTNVLPARPTTEAERIIARCGLERKGLVPFKKSFQNN
jgi:hypothetical protein